MISDTLSDAATGIDRYLIHDDDDLSALPSLEPTRIEVEMQVRLEDGKCVTVVEQVTRMSDLDMALERARFRLAVTLARGVLDGFAHEQGPRITAVS